MPIASSTTTDSEEASSSASENSATRRAREAESRVKDYEDPRVPEEGVSQNPMAERSKDSLPSPQALFSRITKPPDFLNPEAIRQLPYKSREEDVDGATEVQKEQAEGRGKPLRSGEKELATTWDISKAAPKLPEEKTERGRGVGSVISASAVKYDVASRHASSTAVMGDAPSVLMSDAKDVQPHTSKGATHPMSVEDFVGKGGASLPRKRQERKDKEKAKRMRGQSSHDTWKSEAEMALRQQYD